MYEREAKHPASLNVFALALKMKTPDNYKA
jgi:hypothetical protein